MQYRSEVRGLRTTAGLGLTVLAAAALGWSGAQAVSPGPPDACAATRTALAARLPLATPNEEPFVRIQERVLALGCTDLAAFDDPAWFTRTVPLFIGGFLAQGGGWPVVAAGCAGPLMGPLTCGVAMVDEHIRGDLLAALRVAGCGTDHDWARVGTVIERAAAEEGPVWAWGAAVLVPVRRLEVRLRCLRGEWSAP
ncbi:hypothetical protein HNQ07_003696 [Deinococcus metalli]|uniref:Uncharacterized protein n=1 Tax=Deinococcus metalli TaxID=1141878 RepID=A0A7W8KHV9_9DEIO|nr:hypothetical protein [Deinococcus metalli]MBB5378195.1 hypothetical protein [Deinococcus metalli]GHF56740.1 hypothetical protein GCM10017781_36340 [Deinococcus metalli]